MSIVASQLIAKVSTVGATEAEAQLTGVGAASDGAAGKLKALALGGAVIATAALIGIGVASVTMAGQFESGLTSLVTGAGEAESNLKMVSDAILALSVKAGTSTKDLIAGMYMIESANQHGQQAIDTLTAAAEGAKVGMASLADVANGVTTAMTDYASAHLSATDATNTLIAAVSLGKVHLGDLSAAFSTILPTAAAAGVSFRDVAGAMATMTGEGTDAASAATYLRQLLIALEAPGSKAAATLKSIGLTSAEVSDEMKVSLPGALQLIIDHLKKKFPEGSAAYVAALKDIAGGSRQMQGLLELTGSHLKVFKSNVDSITEAVLKGAGGITGWNRVQEDFNFQMDKAKAAVEAVFITIGLKLLPVLTPLVAHVTALLIPFATWIASGHAVGDSMKWLGQNIQIAGPILAGLAAILLAVVVPAMVTTAIATIAALWPFLAIGAAVAGVAAALIYAYQHWTGFREVVNAVAANLLHFWSILQAQFIPTMQHMIAGFMQFAREAAPPVRAILMQIGAFLASNFVPLWDQLVSVVQNQLIPAWKSLVSSIMPLMPTLKQIGMVIGGILVVAVGLLISVLGGLISMFVAILKGVLQMAGGMIQIFTGVFTVIIGLVSFFVDLFTGHWERLGKDLHAILSGLVQVFMGALNVIFGLVNATFGAILAFISGFARAFVGFFTWIWHMLVGGSIIPDMVNGIIQWFVIMAAKTLSNITSFVSMLVSKFGQLPAMALQWGVNLIQGFIKGLLSQIGNLGGALGQIAGMVASFLPHSPAERGPLKYADQFMPRFMKMLSAGIQAGIPSIHAAVSMAVAPIARLGIVAPGGTGGSFAPVSTPYAFPSMQAAAPTIIIHVQSPDMVVDGHRLAGALMPGIVRQIRNTTGVRF